MTGRAFRAAWLLWIVICGSRRRKTFGVESRPATSPLTRPLPEIAGFYTLAAAGVLLGDLPEVLAKRLPRYPSVPVARIGRLAVDQPYRGRKLGSALLWDAGLRALRSEIAAFALIVDAKDDSAAAFYRHHGFIPLSGQPMHLVLPLASFAKA